MTRYRSQNNNKNKHYKAKPVHMTNHRSMMISFNKARDFIAPLTGPHKGSAACPPETQDTL